VKKAPTKGSAGAKQPSVRDYLERLEPGPRGELEKVRRLVRDALPRGYEEGILYGMISWFVPVARCPRTYNGQPLAIASLAAQKDYFALYLMGVYGERSLREALEAEYRKAGRKLDMGKACLRFSCADELPAEVLASVLGEVGVDALVAKHDEAHQGKRLKPVTA
jgi:uncharacterized protein DUF1801